MPQSGQAATPYYVANNIMVVIEGPSTATSRDEALLKAQKIALGQFLAASDATQADKAKTIPDASLSRTMKDFSLQNERVLSQSYQASFMIRFDPTRFDGLLRSYNLALPATREIDLQNVQIAEAVEAPSPVVSADGSITEVSAANPADPMAPVAPAPAILILPILKTNARIILWDDPNAWREAWQKKAQFTTHAKFNIPLGDIDDMNDAPDSGFIKQNGKAQPGLDNMLTRYNAQTLYIALGETQPSMKGLNVKLYRYQDQQLQYKGQVTTTSRPGYLFDDAVTFTAGQIDMLQKGGSLQALTPPPGTTRQVMTVTETATVTTSPVAGATAGRSSLIAVIPIPNMMAWISLQQQLRHTPHVTNMVTNSISANQAVVRVEGDVPLADLVAVLQAQNFTLQPMGGNRYTLYKNR